MRGQRERAAHALGVEQRTEARQRAVGEQRGRCARSARPRRGPRRVRRGARTAARTTGSPPCSALTIARSTGSMRVSAHAGTAARTRSHVARAALLERAVREQHGRADGASSPSAAAIASRRASTVGAVAAVDHAEEVVAPARAARAGAGSRASRRARARARRPSARRRARVGHVPDAHRVRRVAERAVAHDDAEAR